MNSWDDGDVSVADEEQPQQQQPPMSDDWSYQPPPYTGPVSRPAWQPRQQQPPVAIDSNAGARQFESDFAKRVDKINLTPEERDLYRWVCDNFAIPEGWNKDSRFPHSQIMRKEHSILFGFRRGLLARKPFYPYYSGRSKDTPAKAQQWFDYFLSVWASRHCEPISNHELPWHELYRRGLLRYKAGIIRKLPDFPRRWLTYSDPFTSPLLDWTKTPDGMLDPRPWIFDYLDLKDACALSSCSKAMRRNFGFSESIGRLAAPVVDDSPIEYVDPLDSKKPCCRQRYPVIYRSIFRLVLRIMVRRIRQRDAFYRYYANWITGFLLVSSIDKEAADPATLASEELVKWHGPRPVTRLSYDQVIGFYECLRGIVATTKTSADVFYSIDHGQAKCIRAAAASICGVEQPKGRHAKGLTPRPPERGSPVGDLTVWYERDSESRQESVYVGDDAGLFTWVDLTNCLVCHQPFEGAARLAFVRRLVNNGAKSSLFKFAANEDNTRPAIVRWLHGAKPEVASKL